MSFKIRWESVEYALPFHRGRYVRGRNGSYGVYLLPLTSLFLRPLFSSSSYQGGELNKVNATLHEFVLEKSQESSREVH